MDLAAQSDGHCVGQRNRGATGLQSEPPGSEASPPSCFCRPDRATTSKYSIKPTLRRTPMRVALPVVASTASGRVDDMDVTEFTQQLKAEREHLDRQIKLLSDRRRKVDTALSALEDLGEVAVERPADDGVTAPEAPGETPAVHADEEPRAETRTAREDGPQATLRRLMHDRPALELDSKSAHALLQDQGWSTSSKDPVNVVRSALAVLAGAGEITRLGRGKYVYDPTAVSDTGEPTPSTPPVVPGTLDFVESEYGSGSYSSGTSLQPVDDQAV